MIYDDKGKEVQRLVMNGKKIKAAYVYAGEVLRKVFGASAIYYGFGESITTPTEAAMQKIVARESFGPIVVPEPANGFERKAKYFYMYVPTRFTSRLSFYLNDMACTPILAGEGREIGGEIYTCYRFGEEQNGTITIEGRYE